MNSFSTKMIILVKTHNLTGKIFSSKQSMAYAIKTQRLRGVLKKAGNRVHIIRMALPAKFQHLFIFGHYSGSSDGFALRNSHLPLVRFIRLFYQGGSLGLGLRNGLHALLWTN